MTNRVRQTMEQHQDAAPQTILDALAEVLTREPDIQLTGDELAVFVRE